MHIYIHIILIASRAPPACAKQLDRCCCFCCSGCTCSSYTPPGFVVQEGGGGGRKAEGGEAEGGGGRRREGEGEGRWREVERGGVRRELAGEGGGGDRNSFGLRQRSAFCCRIVLDGHVHHEAVSARFCAG